MKTTCELMDMSTFEDESAVVLPDTVIQRGSTERWVVPDRPLVGDLSEIEWALTESGDLVRIPLYPYVTSVAELTAALGYAFELGVAALAAMESHTPTRLHIVVGKPIRTVWSGFRFWLGFGFAVGSS